MVVTKDEHRLQKRNIQNYSTRTQVYMSHFNMNKHWSKLSVGYIDIDKRIDLKVTVLRTNKSKHSNEVFFVLFFPIHLSSLKLIIFLTWTIWRDVTTVDISWAQELFCYIEWHTMDHSYQMNSGFLCGAVKKGRNPTWVSILCPHTLFAVADFLLNDCNYYRRNKL